MTGNNRQHYYVRLDGQGRAIPGSGVRRNKKPKTGSWLEITDANLCCGPYTEISDNTPQSFPIAESSTNTITIACDSGDNVVITLINTTELADLDALIAFLNDKLPVYGQWLTDGTGVILKLKQEIADDLCTEGTLTLTVASA